MLVIRIMGHGSLKKMVAVLFLNSNSAEVLRADKV